jgi:hypothetical protein
MEIAELLENLKTAIFQQDHELNCAKAVMAELQELNPALFHEIMEKLNLV